jgi:hypothetical protein
MKKLALIVLAAASLVGTAGVASAQGYGGGYYGDRYYGDRYRQRYYDDDRYYRRRDSRGSRAVDCYGRVCPRGFSVQDCVCKPYRGY